MLLYVFQIFHIPIVLYVSMKNYFISAILLLSNYYMHDIVQVISWSDKCYEKRILGWDKNIL